MKQQIKCPHCNKVFPIEESLKHEAQELRKKLQAEDLIVINFEHKNGAISSFKATTRADQDYRSSIDVIGTKGRLLVKGISLNLYSYWKKTKNKNYFIGFNNVSLCY